MIDGQNFFDQPVKSNIRTYNNTLKITTGQADDYITSCLLFYPYFSEHYKMIAIDVNKQQALNADPKAKQQIDFTGNIERAGKTTMFFIIEERKETTLDFSQGVLRLL